MPQNNNFRFVNKAVGSQPNFGPFPAFLLIPLLLASVLAYFGYAFLGFSLVQAFFFGAFLLATWWLVTGGNSFRYISRFSRWFKPKWLRSARSYTPFLNHDTKPSQQKGRCSRPPY